MKMLAPGEDAEVEVKKEDQNRISRFSVLSSRSSELETLLEAKKEEKSYLDDAATELELCDDEELVRYKLGEFFMHITAEKARKRIEERNDEISEEVQKLEKLLADYGSEMAQLKVHLYGKFGKSINLERD